MFVISDKRYSLFLLGAIVINALKRMATSGKEEKPQRAKVAMASDLFLKKKVHSERILNNYGALNNVLDNIVKLKNKNLYYHCNNYAFSKTHF